MRKLLASVLVMAFAASVQATDLNLWIVSGGSASIEVDPGATVPYEVWAELSDDQNEGLALIGFDLSCTCGAMPQADTPTTEPMKNFAIGAESLGINNPAGFGGTLQGDVLIQVGGGQNTIGNDVGNAPYPIGGVITGVAQPGSAVVVATGSFTAPEAEGEYDVLGTNIFGNGIVMGETGEPFFKTYQLDPGTSMPLTVAVFVPSGPEIEGSTPASGSIDARQPTDFAGVNPAGWDSIQLDLSGDASGLVIGDFVITLDPPGAAPSITSAVPSGNSITLQLDAPIPTGAWTIITLDTQSVCLGYLPADVDQSLASNASDILRVIDCLNGIETCELYQGDIDRSGAINTQDILRVIDMLNGVAPFTPQPWNGVALPASPCGP